MYLKWCSNYVILMPLSPSFEGLYILYILLFVFIVTWYLVRILDVKQKFKIVFLVPFFQIEINNFIK